MPTAVINTWAKNVPYPPQNEVGASFVYLEDAGELRISDLYIPVDSGLSLEWVTLFTLVNDPSTK